MFQARHQNRLLTHYQQRVRDFCLVAVDVCCRGFAFLHFPAVGQLFFFLFHQWQNEKLEEVFVKMKQEMHQMTKWVWSYGFMHRFLLLWKVGWPSVFICICHHFKGSWMNRVLTSQNWKTLFSIRGTAEFTLICNLPLSLCRIINQPKPDWSLLSRVFATNHLADVSIIFLYHPSFIHTLFMHDNQISDCM